MSVPSTCRLGVVVLLLGAAVVGCGTPSMDADAGSRDGGRDPDGGVADAGSRIDGGSGSDGGRLDSDADVDPCSLCGTSEQCCDGVCIDTTSDARHCSACGAACEAGVNADAACVESECALACDAGFADCTAADGCETDVTTLTDCAACGVACGDYPSTTATCTATGCAYACIGAQADCDSSTPACETDTTTSEAHCGACGRACGPDQVCTGGVCRGWRPLSTVGAPTPRFGATAVWTGTEMIVWGGITTVAGTTVAATGAIYNPATDTWRPMARSRQARMRASAVWTGTQLIVFGGRTTRFASDPPSGDGEVYDLASDTWSDIVATGPPAARSDAPAVWTGAEMILWGGETSETARTSTGARWSPGDAAWRALPSTTLSARANHGGVWSGTYYVVFGGTAAGGARFDPASNTWLAMATTGAPLTSMSHVFVWVPSAARAVEWSSEGAGRYDPATNTWSTVAPFLADRTGTISTATDDAVFIWGGRSGGAYLDDGAMYFPATNTWEGVSSEGAPSPRMLAQAVWTGTEVLVFGGTGVADAYGDGGAYTP